MPSTITTYYSFQPATKARSSQVNTNFSNYRGDLLPINENTASASNNTHYLGGSDHYWAGAYLGQIDFITSTTTATLVLKGDTSATLGAFLFQIEGSTTFSIKSEGSFVGQKSLVTDYTEVTITTDSTWTIPAGIKWISALVCGGGGGGGGGGGTGNSGSDNGGGGGGGGGSFYEIPYWSVTALNVLSITIGLGGSGGAGGPNTGGVANNNCSGTVGVAGANTYIVYNGLTITILGGAGGAGGRCDSTPQGSPGLGGGINGSTDETLWTFGEGNAGGRGQSGNGGTLGSPGSNNYYYQWKNATIYYGGSVGTKGVAGQSGSGGGGGAGLYGVGGIGGSTVSNSAGIDGGAASGYGAGGGGGGGASGNSVNGGKGGAGVNGIVVIRYIPPI